MRVAVASRDTATHREGGGGFRKSTSHLERVHPSWPSLFTSILLERGLFRRMDPNRDPRRARQAVAAARFTHERRAGNEALRPPNEGLGLGQRVTPTNNSASHRTPDQQQLQEQGSDGPAHNGGSSSGGRLPPINPFRLHRGECRKLSYLDSVRFVCSRSYATQLQLAEPVAKSSLEYNNINCCHCPCVYWG